MDIKLNRPGASCSTTGRPFAPGEVFFSALVRGPGGLGRIDVTADAWNAPPENAVAWWRSAYPRVESAAPSLAPVDVLLDVLEELDGKPDDAAFRYLLALELVRRRVLRIHDAPAERGAVAELALACRKRDRDYRVAVVAAAAAAAPGMEDRLSALLWSGEAA